MKILIVSPFFLEPPNSKTGLLEVCHGLIQNKNEVDVIAPQIEDALAYENFHGISIYRYKPQAYLAALPYCIDILLPFRILKHIKSTDYDFVIAITTQFLSTFSTALVKTFTNVPFAIWIHGSTTTTGRLITDIVASIYDKTLARYSVSQADLMLTLSDKLHPKALRLGAAKNTIHTVCNAVDTHRFKPMENVRNKWRRKLNLTHQKTIIYAGRFVPNKGINILLATLPAILAINPNTIFILVGAGPLWEEVDAAAKAYPNNIRVLEFQQTIEELLAASDILVLPSFTEGVPQSILEAYAAGLPVIATDVGGTPDVLTHNENGFLIPSRNITALADAINFALDKENQLVLQRIAETNLEMAALRFSRTAAAKHLTETLERYLH